MRTHALASNIILDYSFRLTFLISRQRFRAFCSSDAAQLQSDGLTSDVGNLRGPLWQSGCSGREGHCGGGGSVFRQPKRRPGGLARRAFRTIRTTYRSSFGLYGGFVLVGQWASFSICPISESCVHVARGKGSVHPISRMYGG